MKAQRSTLVARLTLWIGVFYALGAFLLFLVVVRVLEGRLKAHDRKIISSEAEDYRSIFESGGVRAIRAKEKELKHSSQIINFYVRIINKEGKEIFESSDDYWSRFELHGLKELSKDLGVGWFTSKQILGKTAVLDLLGVPLRNGGVLQVGMSSSSRDDIIAHVAHVLLDFILVSILISSIGASFVAWSGLRPLHTLAGQVEQIRLSGDLRARILGPGQIYRETEELRFSFNLLLGKIERLVTGLRDGLDTLAHEIRSPITRIRMRVEETLKNYRGATKEALEYREKFIGVIEELDRISRIVDEVLDLAEASTQSMKLNKRKIGVSEIVTRVLELYEDAANDRQISLSIVPLPSALIDVDVDRLVQALSNLLDNALKFSSAGDKVVLSAVASNTSVKLYVEDNGGGIDPDDLPLIWERLYRGTKKSSVPGTGLGLALVRAIAIAHNGDTSVVSQPGKGSKFCIELPVADSGSSYIK